MPSDYFLEDSSYEDFISSIVQDGTMDQLEKESTFTQTTKCKRLPSARRVAPPSCITNFAEKVNCTAKFAAEGVGKPLGTEAETCLMDLHQSMMQVQSDVKQIGKAVAHTEKLLLLLMKDKTVVPEVNINDVAEKKVRYLQAVRHFC